MTLYGPPHPPCLCTPTTNRPLSRQNWCWNPRPPQRTTARGAAPISPTIGRAGHRRGLGCHNPAQSKGAVGDSLYTLLDPNRRRLSAWQWGPLLWRQAAPPPLFSRVDWNPPTTGPRLQQANFLGRKAAWRVARGFVSGAARTLHHQSCSPWAP